MKLALIRRQFSATGGAELYLQRLLPELAGKGHELHLFTEAWPHASEGLIVHQIAASGSRSEGPRRFAEAARAETARQLFDCVFSLDRTLRQDVYRAGDGIHQVWLERRRQFAPWWRKPFIGRSAFHKSMLELEALTFSSDHTRHIIANSEMVKREILDRFAFPAERIHIVRNGVDVARFQRGNRRATRARFGVSDDEFLLLFVGSGWERKGLPFLLKAMACWRNRSPRWVARFEEGIARAQAAGTATGQIEHASERSKLLVVGKGRLPLRRSPNVIFTGSMADVEHAYAAADLFVFLPIYEPSANVVFEALAAGLPVVTSSFNGAAELISEGMNGSVLANPLDQDRIAEAVGYWSARRSRIAPSDGSALSLERNVRETIAVLELAAREKAR